jgi:hypothetical protein
MLVLLRRRRALRETDMLCCPDGLLASLISCLSVSSVSGLRYASGYLTDVRNLNSMGQDNSVTPPDTTLAKTNGVSIAIS